MIFSIERTLKALRGLEPEFKTKHAVEWGPLRIHYGWACKVLQTLKQTGIKEAGIVIDERSVTIVWKTGHYRLINPTEGIPPLGEAIQIDEGGQVKDFKGGNVVSFETKLAEKRAEKVEQEKAVNQLKCVDPACGHVVETMDDWDHCFDQAAKRGSPKGYQDSGIHACPECGALQPHSLCDGMVTFEGEGFNAGIVARVPLFLLDEVMESSEPEATGDFFHVGTAILNAIKPQLIAHYGHEKVRAFFPGYDPDDEVYTTKQKEKKV